MTALCPECLSRATPATHVLYKHISNISYNIMRTELISILTCREVIKYIEPTGHRYELATPSVCSVYTISALRGGDRTVDLVSTH